MGKIAGDVSDYHGRPFTRIIVSGVFLAAICLIFDRDSDILIKIIVLK
jgi:hypothetical protein